MIRWYVIMNEEDKPFETLAVEENMKLSYRC
jgi:hypothetical protein